MLVRVRTDVWYGKWGTLSTLYLAFTFAISRREPYVCHIIDGITSPTFSRDKQMRLKTFKDERTLHMNIHLSVSRPARSLPVPETQRIQIFSGADTRYRSMITICDPSRSDQCRLGFDGAQTHCAIQKGIFSLSRCADRP